MGDERRQLFQWKLAVGLEKNNGTPGGLCTNKSECGATLGKENDFDMKESKDVMMKAWKDWSKKKGRLMTLGRKSELLCVTSFGWGLCKVFVMSLGRFVQTLSGVGSLLWIPDGASADRLSLSLSLLPLPLSPP